MAFPDFIPEHPYVVKNFLLCIYGSVWDNPGVDGVGATWFVFTLMWLYFSAPIISWIASKISQLKLNTLRNTLYFVAIAICLFAGQAWRSYVLYTSLDYFHYIYTPPYANLSIFAAGMFLGYYMKDNNQRHKIPSKLLKFSSVMLLFSCTLVFAYILYCSWISHINDPSWQNALVFYKYYAPGLMSMVVLFYIHSFDSGNVKKYSPVTLDNVAKNPLRLIDAFAGISFEFYLIHSLVLNRICNYLRDPYPIQEFMKLLIATFIISTVFAYAFSKAIKGVYTSLHIYNPVEYYSQHKKSLPLIGGVVLFFVLATIVTTLLPY